MIVCKDDTKSLLQLVHFSVQELMHTYVLQHNNRTRNTNDSYPLVDLRLGNTERKIVEVINGNVEGCGSEG